MPDSDRDGSESILANLCGLPAHAPHWLERLAAGGLGAPADDSRLGDLSEQYVRTHQHVRLLLGTAPWAMAASHLAADVCYLAATVNVMLFVRAVDPGVRLAEDNTAALIALDLRERTMAMLRIAARKLDCRRYWWCAARS